MDKKLNLNFTLYSIKTLICRTVDSANSSFNTKIASDGFEMTNIKKLKGQGHDFNSDR